MEVVCRLQESEWTFEDAIADVSLAKEMRKERSTAQTCERSETHLQSEGAETSIWSSSRPT